MNTRLRLTDARTIVLAAGLALIPAARADLPDAFAEYDIDGGGGGYVNTDSNQALSITYHVPFDFGSTASGSINGFY